MCIRDRDPKAGCCGSLTDLFALPFNHHPVVEQGLLEEESAALLRLFFARLREKSQSQNAARQRTETAGTEGES